MAKKVPCLRILDNFGSIGDINADSGLPVTIVNFTDWQIWHESDLTADSNDKTITVPAGYEWQVLWVYVEYTSDANAGARQLQLNIRDAGGNLIGQVRPGVTQAASLTYYYMFGPSLADLTAVRDTDFIMTPFPPTIFLPAGYSVQVLDNNGVSALDDFNFHIHVARREL
jgi:hypothetical protein